MGAGAFRKAAAAALWALALACAQASGAPGGAPDAPAGTITIGLVDTFSPDFYVHTYSPTLDYLAQALPRYRFRYTEIDYRDVPGEIARKKPDFIVSTASTYVTLLDSPGAHQIATRRPAGSVDAAHTLASAFVVPSGSPIKSVAGLRGHSVAIADSKSFDGWLIAQGEIARLNYDPNRFFSSVTETHYGIPGVAELVTLGAADAGVLSTCEYEKLIESGQLREGELKILDERGKEQGESCVRSTDRYPDAVISSLPWCPAETVSDFTIALLSMPARGRDFRWVVESNFQPTWELIKTLGLGPFSHMKDMSPRALWRRYQTEILLGAALLLAVIFHLVSVNLLVRRRTRQLSLAVKATEKLHDEAQKTHMKLARLERESIVSQLSSMFAHEIKQPIMNISLYAGALRLYLKKKGELSEKALDLLESLESEVERSSEIVGHVRSYAKKREARPQASDLKTITEAALHTFSSLPNFVRCDDLPSAPVWVDPFEIQFIVANFVKNALSAVQTVKKPEVRISIRPEGRSWRLTVSDNGPAISDEVFENLGTAGTSSKKDGLGFGLAIAVAIAERNRGHLEFRKRPEGGLLAALILKRSDKEEIP